MKYQPLARLILFNFWLPLLACKSTGASTTLSSERPTFPGGVIVQCLAAPGHGTHWTATMAWLSEIIRLRAEEAQTRSLPAAPVYLDLACMAGGSSGSVMTNVYAALQSNSMLFPQRRSDGLWTAAEAIMLADALRWMALSRDTGVLSYMTTLSRVINQDLETTEHTGSPSPHIARRSSRLPDFFARALSGQKPAWWNGQTVEGDLVLVDAMLLVHAALNLSPTDLNTATAEPGVRLIDLPRFAELSAIPQQSPEADAINLSLEARWKRLQAISDSLLTRSMTPGALKARYAQGVYTPSNHILRLIAEQALDPGFCSITMGALYQRESDVPLDRLPYQELRPLLLCDEATIQAILTNESYQRESRTVGAYGQRFILMQVPTRRGTMAMSIREPRIMRELTGPMGQGRLEINGYYDPRLMSDFKIQAPQGQLAIAGGWPDQRVTAWGISYYAESRVRYWLEQGAKVEGYLSTLGKPESFRLGKFDSIANRELFSAGETAERHLQDWLEFQDAFCEQRQSELAKIGLKTETNTFHSDLASLPASEWEVDRLLAYKGINTARLQTLTGRRDLVFDPDLKRGGELPVGVRPCR
jgi:hypothetical protein